MQRTDTLENVLREGDETEVQTILKTGLALKELRDDHLFKERGFATWDAYLNGRVREQFGIRRRQAYTRIACAEVHLKLPDASCSALHDNGGLTQRVLMQLARLAPKSEEHEQRRDFDKLVKDDLQRVVKKAVEHCEKQAIKLTEFIVQKFVDEDLGVDRAAKAKETREKRERESHPDLRQYILDLTATIDVSRQKLETVSLDYGADAWKQFNERSPKVVERLATACQSLIELMRGVSHADRSR
jgi:hypothetical protein